MLNALTSPPSEASQLLDDQSFRQILRRNTLVLLLALGVPFLVLLGLVLFLLSSASWVAHTEQVIAQATKTEKLLLSMQTGFRGFRLSNSEELLQPYVQAKAQMDGQWKTLRDLVADSPGQTKAVEDVRVAAEAWFDFVEDQLSQVRSGQTQAGDPSFLMVGAPLFNEVMRQLEDVVATERLNRDRRNARLELVTTVLLATLAVGAVIGLPLLSMWLRRRLHLMRASYKTTSDLAHKRAMELYVTLSSIGDAVVATDAKGAVIFLNPVAEKLMGWKSSEARGRPLTEVFDIYNETTGAVAENPVARVLRENIVVGLANHTVLRSRQGTELPIEDSAAPIRDDNGNVLGVILVFHDVSENRVAEKLLRASEQRFRFLNELGEVTRKLVDPDAIMKASIRMLGEHLKVSRCAYADVEADGDSFTIQEDYTDDCVTTAGTYKLALFGPRAVESMKNGQTLVIRDLHKELTHKEGAPAFEAITVQAIICCPLIKEGRLRAMMAVHQRTPRDWKPGEVELVEEVVERCWATIERARAEAEARERAKLSELRANVAERLDVTGPLEWTLQSCCELFVSHLDVALARIWVLDEVGQTLILRASAGLYAHAQGPHTRVPVNSSKLGLLVKSKKAHLSNDLPNDPSVSDPEWVAKEGMVAFAGYPLLVEGSVVGILGLISRKKFSEATLDDMSPMADTLAQYMDRKRAENALRIALLQAEANALAVKDGAERFRLLAEVVSLQVWTANLDGRLDFANQECVEYFGVRNAVEILGHSWTAFVHPEDIANAQRYWETSLATGERYETEFRLRRATGEYRWFLVRAEAMRDGEGRILKWFGTNTDIQDLKQAQYAAERANRAKDSFLAALSHELRTPLTPVLMAAAVLRSDKRLPADALEYLGMMERNIALEARLIDDLLDLTSIAQGKLKLRAQSVDAHSLIGLAIEIVRDDAKAKGITVQRDFAAQRSGLVADPARFQQVIWNLLRNAVKFTPAGGRIAIRTSNESEGRLRIEVRDSGIGILPETLEQIFLPFEQGDMAGDHRFGGLGLGLAIARAIVDMHGGRIEASSEGADQGATFVVELPGTTPLPQGVGETSRDALHPTLPLEPEKSVPEQGAAKRLLLVEDHEDSIQVLLHLLSAAGYLVTPARTVGEALLLAEKQAFDLVISDLGLPDGTGNELMEKLRDKYQLRGIALSGYGMAEDVARSQRSGFITHIMKPVDFAQLTTQLEKLL